jgi:acyl CoA:acetate/3-ketoacid CoA transferase alpha subunit
MTKLIALSEAISKYVNDGDTVYAAGFTHLIPFAAGHEIIRQGKKALTLARATPDLIYDMLVAAVTHICGESSASRRKPRSPRRRSFSRQRKLWMNQSSGPTQTGQ